VGYPLAHLNTISPTPPGTSSFDTSSRSVTIQALLKLTQFYNPQSILSIYQSLGQYVRQCVASSDKASSGVKPLNLFPQAKEPPSVKSTHITSHILTISNPFTTSEIYINYQPLLLRLHHIIHFPIHINHSTEDPLFNPQIPTTRPQPLSTPKSSCHHLNPNCPHRICDYNSPPTPLAPLTLLLHVS